LAEVTPQSPESGWDRPVAPARLAAALVAGWVLPGAGHAVLGRFGRAVVFGAIVLCCFGLGLAHEGRIALIDPTEGTRIGLRGVPGIYLSLGSLQLLANVGVGPLDTLARRSVYGDVVYLLPAVAGDLRENLLRKVRSRVANEASNYGTAYLWTAGLMNLLLLLDIWDIGRGRKT
jgi:hypothetical protein